MARLRRCLIAVTIGATVVALLVGVAMLLATGTEIGRDFLRARVLALLHSSIDGDVAIGEVGGALGRSLVLRDLRLTVEHRAVARIPEIEIVYAPLELLRGRLLLPRVTVTEPWVRLVRTETGWRLPWRGQHDTGGFGVTALSIHRLEVVNGRFTLGLLGGDATRRLGAAALAAELAATVANDRLEVRISRLAFTPRGIALSPVQLSGIVSRASGTGACVTDLHIATRRSRLNASGCIDPPNTLAGHLSLAPLDAGELHALVRNSPLRMDVPAATVDLEGPWRSTRLSFSVDLGPAGRVKGTTTLNLAADPVRYRGHARFSDVAPGAMILDAIEARLNGHVRLSGHGVDADATLDYRLALEPSQIEGYVLESARLDGWAHRGTHRLRGRTRTPAGRAAFRARVSATPAPSYLLKTRVEVDHLEAMVPSIPARGTARIALKGSGVDRSRRSAELRATMTDASVHGVTITHGSLHAALENQRVRLRALSLRGPAGRSTATGWLDLENRTFDLSLEGAAELARLGDHLGTPLAGSLHAKTLARGSLDALAVDTTIEGHGVAYGGMVADQLTLGLNLSGDAALAAATGTADVEAAGVRLGSVDPRTVKADVQWTRAGHTDRASLRLAARSDGMTDRLVLDVTRSNRTTRGELRELVFTVPGGVGPPWQLVQPTSFVVGDGLDVEPVVLRAGPQQLSLHGRLAFRGQNDASLGLRSFELGPLCAATGLPECTGTLSGDVALSGTPAAPHLEAGLTVDNITSASVDCGSLEVAANYADRLANAHATLRMSGGGMVELDGRVPMDLAWAGTHPDLGNVPMTAQVTARDLDLSVLHALSPQAVRAATGRLMIDLRLTGPRRAPRLQGRAALADGSIELATSGVPYEDVEAIVTAANHGFELRHFHARSGEGTLEGSGRAELGEGGRLDLSLVFDLEEFLAVRRRMSEAAVSGNLEVHGPLTAPEITGDIEVTRGLLRPARLPTSVAPHMEEDSTIEVIDVPAMAPSRLTPPNRVGDPVRLAVNVRFRRNAWVRRQDADIELAGDLRLDKVPYEDLRPQGHIELLQGWCGFQGRRFTVVKGGTIRFPGGNAPPELDVRATHRSGQYMITIRITGPSSSPTLTLSSEPPLEEADILSVLLFGKPAGELGRGQEVMLQQQAVQLAGSYAIGGLRTSVMDVLNLDTLDIELPQGSDKLGRVSAGRYLTGDVFVSLAGEFGANPAEVVSVEYNLTPSVSIRGTTSSRGTSTIDLLWQRRY